MHVGIKKTRWVPVKKKKTLLLTSLGHIEWQSTSLSTRDPLKDALLLQWQLEDSKYCSEQKPQCARSFLFA